MLINDSPPAVDVLVTGKAPVTGVSTPSGIASVSCTAPAPLTAAVSSPAAAEVVARGMESGTGGRNTPPAAVVDVSALGATTSAINLATTATVVATALGATNRAVNTPQVALVWVYGLAGADQSDEAGTGKVIVLNANTLAVSEYSLAALDVVEHEGEVWFVTATELSKLTTGTVDASVETGVLSLGADDKKYIAGVKAHLSGDSTTTVVVAIELDGREVELGPYDLPARSGSASFVRQFKLAGGVKADSVSLKFETVAGTAWKLDGLALLADSL